MNADFRYIDGAKISFFSEKELKDLITLVKLGIEHIEEYHDENLLNYKIDKHKTDLKKLEEAYDRYLKFNKEYYKEIK